MFSRRRFLLASSSLVALTPLLGFGSSTQYPFTLGVASGCPRDNSVVLWTRLAPKPLQGGGMPSGIVAVRYRVCSDPSMKTTVRQGVVQTSEIKGHSVHVTVDGLRPGREYWYQFYLGDDDSPIGRTRTSDSQALTTTLALAACQHYESGYFGAFRDLAKWAPDCVIHVGDYIYEGAARPLYTCDENNSKDLERQVVRQHNGAEITTLWDYRNRYALYRLDSDLQAAHAASPWIVAMDDHEIDNNWANNTPQDPWAQTELEFKVRRLAALQAYYEHMPLEHPPVINGIDATLHMHDVYRMGPAQIHLLDTRQYRSDQVCGQGFPADFPCDALQDPTLTMTGQAQEKWLFEHLRKSDAEFNVLAQQTWFSPYRYAENDKAKQWNMDQWDGYPIQRQRIIDRLADVSNPVVLSGDWHCANANTIHRDPLDSNSSIVGHEFATSSISSNCPWKSAVHDAAPLNEHVHYVNGDKRGYLRSTVTKNNWKSEYRVMDKQTSAEAKASTDYEFNTRDA
ncbi:alkaline phosphatase [Paraglaciecola sp. L3A3]|uniref:alkaline phosphatase D family protein n=1 Tax=Paraglaciecola sp. L3A3 TaxID=2686358 RepID=UPI00131ADB7D|nr:alkaline phosphatase D family protein [Paraglaciecola sp. L3A3]